MLSHFMDEGMNTWYLAQILSSSRRGLQLRGSGPALGPLTTVHTASPRIPFFLLIS